MIDQEANYTTFIQNEVSPRINTLKADKKPIFGIMTAQHMVEHLSYTIKISIKTLGNPPEKPTEHHEKWKKFIFSDAEFRISDPAKAKLVDLKFNNIEDAKADLVKAIDRFYTFFKENPKAKPYNDFFGELSKDELERFHYKHFKHHLKQFELL